MGFTILIIIKFWWKYVMLNINNMIEVILLTGTPSFITKNYVPSTGSKPHTGHMGNAASISSSVWFLDRAHVSICPFVFIQEYCRGIEALMSGLNLGPESGPADKGSSTKAAAGDQHALQWAWMGYLSLVPQMAPVFPWRAAKAAGWRCVLRTIYKLSFVIIISKKNFLHHQHKTMVC